MQLLSTIKSQTGAFSKTIAKGTRSKNAKWVAYFLVALAIAAIIYDFYLYFGERQTISSKVREWAMMHYFGITWVWGILAGHFFIPKRKADITISTLMSVMILSLFLAILIIVGLQFDDELPQYVHLILLFVGAVMGHMLWAQSEGDTVIRA